MTTQDLDTRIRELENAVENPGKFPTEVYTRIVGYYRSLANWNAGKREEFDHRKTFSEDESRIKAALAKAEAKLPELKNAVCENEVKAEGKAASYLVFLKKFCPNCPALKAKLPELTIDGTSFDTETDEGFNAAVRWTVTATPTLILLNEAGQELKRITSALEWKEIQGYL